MKLLVKILNKVNVVHLHFDAEGCSRLGLLVFSVRKREFCALESRPLEDPAAEKKTLSSAPVILAVSGKGVLTKDEDRSGITETATSDPATFLWTRAAGKISFVRKEQIAKVYEQFAGSDIPLLFADCLPQVSESELKECAERFFTSHLTWKRVLLPSDVGSQLALHISKRIRLPVLGTLVAVLLVNFLVSGPIREELRNANTELTALRKTVTAESAGSGRKQAAMEIFSRALPYKFSWLSDNIAAAVPGKIVLSELAISPILKNVEPGKPLLQAESSIVIRGETDSAEHIAAFVETLTALQTGKVRLSTVEHDRDKSITNFKIEMEL